MNVTIFEACRSPEINKSDTEGIILSRFFKQAVFDFVLYSNDGIWPDRMIINRELILRRLALPTVSVVHLAMHGFEKGLALRWSDSEPPPYRTVIDLLSVDEIRKLAGWDNKLIVSGACKSAYIAQAFLDAGAKGVIAPSEEIPWANLGAFFRIFYTVLGMEASPCESLAEAVKAFPEYDNFVCSEPANKFQLDRA